MILALRTDKSEAELYLLDEAGHASAEHRWWADRELANQLLGTIEDFLGKNQTVFNRLTGLIVFQGPGSFTGLRIGVTVANGLAYAQSIPVIAAGGDDWLQKGTAQLENAKIGIYALPEYGAPANVTVPKV
jgi:tRNA threonylcarbamoyladenosine biosynthesis protein TsaB